MAEIEISDGFVEMSVAILVALSLAVGGYAWAIGFSSINGVVVEKVSEPHRYGDYLLVVDGKEWVPPRNVYEAAKIGSEIQRPFAMPFVMVDGQRHVMWFRVLFAAVPALLGIALVAAVGWMLVRDRGKRS
ncbi:MAG TPA: hypothetical protein VKA04_00290 [Pseudodesulfovibrio sp.]|nr:hypothetical protein [Pseudodesulfovibrio sp.]